MTTVKSVGIGMKTIVIAVHDIIICGNNKIINVPRLVQWGPLMWDGEDSMLKPRLLTTQDVLNIGIANYAMRIVSGVRKA